MTRLRAAGRIVFAYILSLSLAGCVSYQMRGEDIGTNPVLDFELCCGQEKELSDTLDIKASSTQASLTLKFKLTCETCPDDPQKQKLKLQYTISGSINGKIPVNLSGELDLGCHKCYSEGGSNEGSSVTARGDKHNLFSDVTVTPSSNATVSGSCCFKISIEFPSVRTLQMAAIEAGIGAGGGGAAAIGPSTDIIVVDLAGGDHQIGIPAVDPNDPLAVEAWNELPIEEKPWVDVAVIDAPGVEHRLLDGTLVQVGKREFIRGNAWDLDGSVISWNDVAAIEEFINNTWFRSSGTAIIPSTRGDAYDVNDDGEITFADRDHLARHLLQQGPPPAPPFPAPGEDPTSDSLPGYIALMGVSPELQEAVFARGDANQDRAWDVADASFMLEYLFLGRELPDPYNFDRMDVDDDGQLKINDAIYLLSHLFLGGAAVPEPVPPNGGEGLDTTSDELGVNYCAPCGVP